MAFKDPGWMDMALCAPGGGFDPDLWSRVEESAQSMARHVCIVHCQVLAICPQRISPARGMTIAGVTYASGAKVTARKIQPKMADLCKKCSPTP